jgi:ferredoxin-fold anticodon binding domain-containing protein
MEDNLYEFQPLTEVRMSKVQERITKNEMLYGESGYQTRVRNKILEIKVLTQSEIEKIKP